MADYNIYIKDAENLGGNKASPTTPKDIATSSNGEQASAFQTASKGVQNFTSSGFQGAVNTGVATLTKAFPALAVISAAIKISDKVLTTGFAHLEDYTGNYQYAMNYNNFKTAIGLMMNPVQTLSKQVSRQFQWDKANKQIEQNRTLIGRSIIDQKIGV